MMYKTNKWESLPSFNSPIPKKTKFLIIDFTSKLTNIFNDINAKTKFILANH